MRALIDTCRDHDVPVIYAVADANERLLVGGATKISRSKEESWRDFSAPIPELIAPRPGELVVPKTKASAFFGTPLVVYLGQRKIDSVLVVGTTVSGCIQATITDAHSYGYHVYAVEDCLFDKSSFMLNAYLFNMGAKYADVITLQVAIDALCARGRVHPHVAAAG
jgi:nicotinamidase-related amidase